MIRFENVTKVYPRSTRPALDDVSVGIDRGEFVFVVGPSGSGKSTMLRLALREEAATEGTVLVAGHDLGSMAARQVPRLRREMGAVFQDFRLLPNKTVHENVAYALQVIGKPGHVIRQLVPETVNPQLVRLLPEEMARAKQVVPIGVEGGVMTLAMAAPDDIETISEAELLTGYHVEPVATLDGDVQATLDRGFDDRIVARQTIVDMKLADLEEAGGALEDEPDSTGDEEKDAPVVRLVRALVRSHLNYHRCRKFWRSGNRTTRRCSRPLLTSWLITNIMVNGRARTMSRLACTLTKRTHYAAGRQKTF